MTGMYNSARWSVSQQWLITLLDEQFAEHTSGPQLVVDLGGGTGSIAAHLAEHGHEVTVIDPSPDQLANTDRRAREMDLTERLATHQGDTGTLCEVVEPHSIDAVLCHLVLSDVTDRAGTLQNIASVLRPGGVVSLLVRQPYQRILRHVIDGDLRTARELLEDDGWVRREDLLAMLEATDFTVLSEYGVGAIADVVSADVSTHELLELERAVASRAEWITAASSLHVMARSGAVDGTVTA